MTGPINERPSGRRRFRILGALFASALVAAGLSAVLLGSTDASAANVAINQCNGIHNTPGLTWTCTVTVHNTLTDDPLTSGSVVTVNNDGAISTTPSSDIVTSVTQCNNSGLGGGGTMTCSVNIINDITMSGPGAAGTATVNECNANQAGDGLGNAPNTCNPYPASTSGATITQCNGTGNSGGLVNAGPFSHCSASGMVSSSLPVTVNQCNDSEDGGGGNAVLCTVSITTNVVDTAAVVSGPSSGGGTPSGVSIFGLSTGSPATPVRAAAKTTG